jgi:hypothetical protein
VYQFTMNLIFSGAQKLYLKKEQSNLRVIMKSKNIPCDCAFCVQERKITELRLKGSLTRIQEQLDQSSRKNNEYQKTVRMLRLVNKYKER